MPHVLYDICVHGVSQAVSVCVLAVLEIELSASRANTPLGLEETSKRCRAN